MFLDPWARAIMSLRPLETKQQVHPHNQVTVPAGTSLCTELTSHILSARESQSRENYPPPPEGPQG